MTTTAMKRKALAAAASLAACGVASVAAPTASATTFGNDAPIVIPAGSLANPYPSTITVSGTAAPITDINVGLDGLTSGRPTDLHIALVAPSGQALLLMGCSGQTDTANNVSLTFDDSAPGQLPNAPGVLTTGTFKPTSHCGDIVRFDPPGPTVAYGNPGPGAFGTASFGGVFNGLSPIGTWSLYAFDRVGAGGTTTISGWSLDVNPNVTPLPPVTAPTPMVTPTPAVTSAPTPAKKKKKKKKRKKKK